MRRHSILIKAAITSAAMTLLVVGLAAAEPPGVGREPFSETRTGDVRDYELYLIRGYATMARYEARDLTKGPAATHYRLKTVEYDELTERVESGEPVSYREISEALDSLLPWPLRNRVASPR
jgi:hypothetical protein